MNGELRVSRPRWWGAWVVLAVLALGLGTTGWLAMEQGTPDMLEALRGATIVIVPLALVVYAPWTFFPIARFIGLFVFLATSVRCLVSWGVLEGFVNLGPDDTPSRAARGLLAYGIPGLSLMLLRVPPACPYDDAGHPMPFEEDVVVRVEPLDDLGEASQGSTGLTRLRPPFDYDACPRPVETTSGRHAQLRIVLPSDRLGEAIFTDWTRRLRGAGWQAVVLERRAGTRSLGAAMLAGIYERRWFGRRVPRTRRSAPKADGGTT